MPTEEQIKELAYYLWEQDGKPTGNDQEYYFKARQVLEEREAAKKRASEAPASPASAAPRRTSRRRK
jgi:hypothetical protein